MKDFAISDDPAVQAQLDRLGALSVPQGRLGLETVTALLGRLGDPHKCLSPVFHVAGTNGKGSACAFLRAILEAQGHKVHVTTSPHLVRYNERFRLAGELISDADLAALLAEVLDASGGGGGDLSPSFFEVTIAAAFLAFSRVPADACVVEVGLGGRFDATNVLPPEAVAACGIAALGLDHEKFLLAPESGVPEEPIVRIGFEKAGIAKSGVPLITQSYAPEVERELIRRAAIAHAPLAMRERDWWTDTGDDAIKYRDHDAALTLPIPSLPGEHQAENAALAVAMIRHQDKVQVSEAAIAQGLQNTSWPARLQILSNGPVTDVLAGRSVLLDGGHNPQAGAALADWLAKAAQPIDAVMGMLASKDARGFLEPLAPHLASLTAVPIGGHENMPPAELAALASELGIAQTHACDSLEAALTKVPKRAAGTVFVGGSLYFAGTVLSANREFPD